MLGGCDPAERGEAWNTTVLSDANGAVTITCRWEWDRTSTRQTGCDGPILDVRVQNALSVPWYARLPGKRRGGKFIEIPPGTDQTTSGKGALRSLGLETNADFADVTLGPTSTA